MLGRPSSRFRPLQKLWPILKHSVWRPRTIPQTPPRMFVVYDAPPKTELHQIPSTESGKDCLVHRRPALAHHGAAHRQRPCHACPESLLCLSSLKPEPRMTTIRGQTDVNLGHLGPTVKNPTIQRRVSGKCLLSADNMIYIPNNLPLHRLVRSWRSQRSPSSIHCISWSLAFQEAFRHWCALSVDSLP